ncbi:MAG TPA: hypothetical protein VIP11_05575 [Gemmatimonadaceae bacterium]
MLSLLSAAVTPLVAQRRDVVSFDVTLGAGRAWGGRLNYVDEPAVGGEITVGIRSKPDETLSRVAAVAAGGQFRLGRGDKCSIDLSATVSACRPNYPDMGHIAVLGGLEHRQTSYTSLRALIGPALYMGGASGLGGQVQFDASAGFSHIALVAVARGNLLVRYSGEPMRFGWIGFGFRVQ